jgi:hypothetical protein
VNEAKAHSLEVRVEALVEFLGVSDILQGRLLNMAAALANRSACGIVDVGTVT